VLTFPLRTHAQSCANLVPNGSFEQFSNLPDDDCDWFLATGWTNAAATSFCSALNGSPDYFHLQGTGAFSALPSNYFASLTPFDGAAVMGVGGYLDFAADAREYLSIALTCPLVVGETYELQFRITQGTPNVGGYSVNGWGIALTEAPLLQPAGCNCPITATQPQFEIPNVVSNAAWETFNFTFTATAAHEYLTFGNFLTDAEHTIIPFGTTGAFGLSYCFVDDFSLVPLGSTPTLDLGPDRTQCANAGEVTLAAGAFSCATYLWSTGQTTASITAQASGNYAVTVTSSCGTQVDEVNVTVVPAAEQFLTATICAGETYPLNGQNYTEAGTYTQTFPTATGCDSTVVLTLALDAPAVTNLVATSCADEIFTLNGETFTEAGTYEQLLLASTGCDSLVVLNLSVAPVATTLVTAGIIAGENYLLNGESYTQPGTYTQLLTSAAGCDSTVMLTLTVQDQNVYLPNAFSPNQDGSNDYFKPYLSFNTALRPRTLAVFNKWGGQVYAENASPGGSELPGWDGTFLGQPAAEGIYVYYLVLEQENGIRTTVSGDVLLLR